MSEGCSRTLTAVRGALHLGSTVLVCRVQPEGHLVDPFAVPTAGLPAPFPRPQLLIDPATMSAGWIHGGGASAGQM